MKLAAEKPGVIFELDHLHQVAIRGETAQNHALGLVEVAVAVVEFVAVAVALRDLSLAVKFQG